MVIFRKKNFNVHYKTNETYNYFLNITNRQMCRKMSYIELYIAIMKVVYFDL